MRSPRKILVICSGGAGKSTFARRLGEIPGLDVVHLDALYWKPGWVEPSKSDWVETVRDVLKRDAWMVTIPGPWLSVSTHAMPSSFWTCLERPVSGE